MATGASPQRGPSPQISQRSTYDEKRSSTALLRHAGYTRRAAVRCSGAWRHSGWSTCLSRNIIKSINCPFFADRSLGIASLHAKVRQKNYETSLWVHYTASSIGFYGQGRVHCGKRALSRLTGTRYASCVKRKLGFM